MVAKEAKCALPVLTRERPISSLVHSAASLALHECVIGRLSSIVSIAGFSYVSVGVGGSIELPILFVSAVGGAQLTVDAASVIQVSQESSRDADYQFQGLEKFT